MKCKCGKKMERRGHLKERHWRDYAWKLYVCCDIDCARICKKDIKGNVGEIWLGPKGVELEHASEKIETQASREENQRLEQLKADNVRLWKLLNGTVKPGGENDRFALLEYA